MLKASIKLLFNLRAPSLDSTANHLHKRDGVSRSYQRMYKKVNILHVIILYPFSWKEVSQNQSTALIGPL